MRCLSVFVVLVAILFSSCATGSSAVVTPLHEAVRDGMQDEAVSLIDAGADVDARDEEGRTALHYACANGDSTLGFLLINSAADTGIQDDEGRTALYYASENCYSDLVEALLEAGASPDIADLEGRLPVDVAPCGDVKKLLSD